jgi:agarase
MQLRRSATWFCLLTIAGTLYADAVSIRVNPLCVRSIGGVSRFRREQFITIHASPVENDTSPEDRDFLVSELEVSYGREGGSRTWRRSQTPADAKRPDFPDVKHIRRAGAEARATRRYAQ